MNPNQLGMRRRFYKLQLSLAWIAKHKPDILTLIEKEVDKKYPITGPRRVRTALPKALS